MKSVPEYTNVPEPTVQPESSAPVELDPLLFDQVVGGISPTGGWSNDLAPTAGW